MAEGFVLAVAAEADGSGPGHHGEKRDDLLAFRGFHLALVAAGEGGEGDRALALFVGGDEIGAGGDDAKPQVEVVAALPIFAADASRRLARDAEAETSVIEAFGAVAVAGDLGWHKGRAARGNRGEEI